MLYNTDINELIRFRDHMNKVQEEYLLYDEYTWEIHNSQKKLDEPSLVWSIIKALTNLFILWAIVIFGVQFALYKEWGFAVKYLSNALEYIRPTEYAQWILLGGGLFGRVLGAAVVKSNITPFVKHIRQCKKERFELYKKINHQYSSFGTTPPVSFQYSRPDVITQIIEEMKYRGCKTVSDAVRSLNKR